MVSDMVILHIHPQDFKLQFFSLRFRSFSSFPIRLSISATMVRYCVLVNRLFVLLHPGHSINNMSYIPYHLLPELQFMNLVPASRKAVDNETKKCFPFSKKIIHEQLKMTTPPGPGFPMVDSQPIQNRRNLIPRFGVFFRFIPSRFECVKPEAQNGFGLKQRVESTTFQRGVAFKRQMSSNHFFFFGGEDMLGFWVV